MAQFPKLKFTNDGMKMLIKAQNGHSLTFTCAKLGSGTLEITMILQRLPI